MKKTKKILALVLALAMVCALFGACGKKDEPLEDVTVRIGGLKGPTSIGMVKMMEDDANSASAVDYEFTIAGTAAELTPMIAQGTIDMIALPVNAAATLFNKTEGAVEMLAVNTLGVLYIVNDGDSVKSVQDLKGKTILATGKGTTPEYSLAYILKNNGIDPEKDVTIEWKSEASEIVATMASMQGEHIALLPQPYVTVAQGKIQGLKPVISLSDEWTKIDSKSELVTGAMIVRKAFLEEHPKVVEKVLEEYKASTKYANESVEDAANLVEKYGIFQAAVAKKAIPACNIVCITGDEMKNIASAYLQVLYGMNPSAVGGKVPTDEFYYVAK